MFRSSITVKMVWASKQFTRFAISLAVPNVGTTLKLPLLVMNIPKVPTTMARQEDVTEALKAADQMEWVRRMNSIRNRAEEIVLTELVYE